MNNLKSSRTKNITKLISRIISAPALFFIFSIISIVAYIISIFAFSLLVICFILKSVKGFLNEELEKFKKILKNRNHG